jgi:hypothetical protein
LLIKWNDHPEEPYPREFYENLFTEAGSGTNNMVDYFFTMSHETLDLTASEVFGWFTLDRPRTDYVGNAYPLPAGTIDRNGLLDLARNAAASNGVDLSRYYGVVVVANTRTDLCGWLGGKAALCDNDSLSPSLLGQEMGHGYGLQHSRVDGSTNDYQDPWDTMSTASAYEAPSAAYTNIGPGLNAANMSYMGWLDMDRVWTSSSGSFSQQIELRPLHRHDLPGLLAAKLPGTTGGFFVEYRERTAWDASIPRSCVMVHRLQDGHSYRMLNAAGTSDLVVGDTFSSTGDFPWTTTTDVRVDEIREEGHYAKVTVSHRLATVHAPGYEVWQQVLGLIPAGGGGVVIINGQLHPVPPWGPFSEVLRQVAAHQFADQIYDPIVRLGAKKAALSKIMSETSALLADLTETETPPLEGLTEEHERRDTARREAVVQARASERPGSR